MMEEDEVEDWEYCQRGNEFGIVGQTLCGGDRTSKVGIFVLSTEYNILRTRGMKYFGRKALW